VSVLSGIQCNAGTLGIDIDLYTSDHVDHDMMVHIDFVPQLQ